LTSICFMDSDFFRKELTLNYNVNEFPFAIALAELLESEGELASLHRRYPGQNSADIKMQTEVDAISNLSVRKQVQGTSLRSQTNAELRSIWPLCPALADSLVKTGRYAFPQMKKKMNMYTRAYQSSTPYQKFVSLYEKFIVDVVAPHINDPQGLLYQFPPTLRISMPAAHAYIKPHRDGDYKFHQEQEVNFWVPVTSVFGNNTLFIESAPDAQDFHPLELQYGQMARFWGYACKHYTVPNDSDHTRVSFDFRVIPKSLFVPDFPGFRAGKIGDYGMRELLRPGVITSELLDARELQPHDRA
jgi:hypothetical protein